MKSYSLFLVINSYLSFFHVDRCRGADIHTGATFRALLLIDFCDAILHRDGFGGAFVDTGFTTDTEILVYFCWH